MPNPAVSPYWKMNATVKEPGVTRSASKNKLTAPETPRFDKTINDADLLSYIQKYKQMELLREIEKRFGVASYLNL